MKVVKDYASKVDWNLRLKLPKATHDNLLWWLKIVRKNKKDI